MVNSKNLESVRKYLAIHKKEIIGDYQAAGAGVGKMNPQDDSYVIVVYLIDKQSLPDHPVKIDGITFKFEVTGQFILHT